MNDKKQLKLFQDQSAPAPGHADKVTLLALNEIPGVGFVTVKTLFDAYEGRLSSIWDTSTDELLQILRRISTIQATKIVGDIALYREQLLSDAEERLRLLQLFRKTSIVFRDTEEYPRTLLDLEDAPPWLFVEGNPLILRNPALVAVVGTREPTQIGLEAARRLSINLARWGYGIVSGLAEGIDAVGHQIALDYGIPTIAVLGHGVGKTFPSSTARLRRRIVDAGGAVISEYLPNDTYTAERFVQRNRIQAALSGAVAVVEGKSRSGTAHTVRFARGLGRPVFGVQMGGLTSLPQHSLLNDLQQVGDVVFDLQDPGSSTRIREFLVNHGLTTSESEASARLFKGVLTDIQRLRREYDASPQDLQWLIQQIRSIAHTEGE